MWFNDFMFSIQTNMLNCINEHKHFPTENLIKKWAQYSSFNIIIWYT